MACGLVLACSMLFRVQGVSVTGCADAGSTQARTLTCMSPPPPPLHPCLDLYGFRALSNSDRVPVFLFVLCTRLFRDWALPGHLSRPGGCTVWAGSGSRVLVLIEIEPAWRPSSLEPGELVQTRRVPGLGLGLARGL